MDKVTVVGAGNVGATTAQRIVESGMANVVMLDIVEDLAIGKALDIAQSLSFLPVSAEIIGGSDYALAEGSSLVVITAGLPRKPGMSRSDLLQQNANIIRDVVSKIAEVAPHAILLLVTNPLDEMAYLAWKVSGFDQRKVMGMAGTLDCARFQYFISRELCLPPSEVRTIILGSHGDSMVPLSRYTYAGGVPISQLLSSSKIAEFETRTRDGGAEIVSYIKTGSAYYAPSAAVFRMVRAILRDENSVLPASVYLSGEYGIEGIFMGVPVRLGRNGRGEVIELDSREREALERSAQHIRSQIKELENFMS